jgi:PadR family transcriptional regulator, regulatory protein PadR
MTIMEYGILAALLDESPLYGYELVKRIAAMSSGEIRVTAASLYAALDRLDAAGQVRIDREEIVSGRARRYFALTPAGEDAVRAEASRLRAAADLVLARRRGRARVVTS